MMALTDASEANKSGTKLEEEVEFFLKSNGFSYKKEKSGAPEIDFIIPLQGNRSIFADCTNQNKTGSVIDKIPHKVWKYWKKYEYDEVYIVRGSKLPTTTVIEHLNWFKSITGVDTHFVTLEEFCKILSNQETYSTYSPLEQFFK